MKTIIKWHKTAEELPEQKEIKIKNKKGETSYFIDEPCLVIWEDKVKPSRFLTKENRWEGHTEEQVPEFWVKINELTVEQDQ